MKSVIFTLLFVNIFIFLCEAKEPASKPSILFIPLDASPPCLKMTEKMGLIGNAELISPPMRTLGNFQEPGKSRDINAWILQQDLESIVCFSVGA